MNVTHVGRYVRSPRVARWKKLLGVVAVLYAIMPIDFVPDAIPILGWLDDVGLLTAAFGFIVKDMAKNAKREKEEAANVPPSEVIVDAER
jgi:uncharacterized membrane protein YkvA (DUF1232 family)